MKALKETATAPLLFRLGKRLIRANLRGGHRLCNLAAQWGMLDVLVQYRLPRGIVFTVPIANEDYRWDEFDLQHYEHESIQRFAKTFEGRGDVTLFDCGADIGLFSASVCAMSPAVRRIYAFEPNASVIEVLQRNAAALPAETHVLPYAVGNIDGTGALVSPTYDTSAHARFITPGQGGIEIRRIDSLGCSDPNIALKIDVEGGELEVLQGARATLAAAKTAAVIFEAHPGVAQRTGRSPVQCMQFLSEIRPFQFTVAETGAPVAAERDFSAGAWKSHINIIAAAV